MPTSINKWIKEQLDDCDESKFGYFDFVAAFNFTSPRIGDQAYTRALTNASQAAARDKRAARIIQGAKNKFKRRNNPASAFGSEYQAFWARTSSFKKAVQTEKRCHHRIEKVQLAAMRVAKRASCGLAGDNAGAGSSSASTDAHFQESSAIEKQDRVDLRSTPAIDAIFRSREELLEFVEPFDLIGLFRIIDLTSGDMKNCMDEVQSAWGEKLKLPVWVPDVPCEVFIKNFTSGSPNPQAFRIKARQRQAVLSAERFDIYLHHDLRALEILTEACLDIIQGPKNTMSHEDGEGTLAVEITIPFLNALFRIFSDIIELNWIEVGTEVLNKHNWDGLGLANNGNTEVVSFLLELSGGTSESNEKVRSDEVKLYRNALRSVNRISNLLSDQHPIRVFVCHYHNKVLSFESLTLVDNRKYIRQRHVQVKIPQTGQEIKDLLENIHMVFGWRNAVVQQARVVRGSRSLE